MAFPSFKRRSHGGMKNRNSWMNVPGWRSGPHTWQNQGSGGPSQDREIRKNCFNPLEKPNSSCAHSLLMSMGNAGALVLCKSYVLKNFCLFYLLLFIYWLWRVLLFIVDRVPRQPTPWLCVSVFRGSYPRWALKRNKKFWNGKKKFIKSRVGCSRTILLVHCLISVHLHLMVT